MIVDESRPLQVVQPFDFSQSLRFLGQFTPAMGEQVINPRSLTKAVLLNGQVAAVRVSDSSAPDSLRLDLFADVPLAASAKDALQDRASFFLSLDDDLIPFYALAEHDPNFAPIVQQLHGYHQVKFLTPFENACWAVLSNRNRMAIASSMKTRLTQAFGGAIVIDGVVHHAFPEPQALLEADAEDLEQVIGHAQKAGFLRHVALAFTEVDEGWLRTGPIEDVEAWLLAVKGIGPWSASFVLVRGLGRMEAFKVPEQRLIDAASRLYGHILSARDVLHLAQDYPGWQGYWAHYVRAAMT
ncbi:MAG: DNA-3-methyladenine glycosylase 2 family protein [Anaerolineae bacterium]|nr:DNA-3-methyladenine glycosylase 2 family protein [Anaerolineae bacterium]